MGMSYPKGMDAALTTIMEAQSRYLIDIRQQSGADFTPGQRWVDQPNSQKDYGRSMNLAVWEIDADAIHCHRIGYVRIKANGSASIPKALRQTLAPYWQD